MALTDQWYLMYGEEEWLAKAKECLSKMQLYSDENLRQFDITMGWLKQWALSRSFGLGTRLPWDPEFLVESLSDSTIYMAYYTIAHILQVLAVACGGLMVASSGSQIRAAFATAIASRFCFRCTWTARFGWVL